MALYDHPSVVSFSSRNLWIYTYVSLVDTSMRFNLEDVQLYLIFYKEITMSKTKSKLKDCPFCGSLEIDIVEDFDGTFEIFCSSCGVKHNNLPTQRKAVLRWNTRIQGENTNDPTFRDH